MFNDLKAPRFNNRTYRKNIVSEELYLKWKEKYNYNLTFSDFKKIWNLIAEGFINNIIEEKDGIKLPRMGEIYIGYVPNMTKKPIDYKTSSEINKKVTHENWNSGNKVGKIIYGNHRKYLHKLAAWWSFEGCRVFKRRVSKALKTTPEKYKNSIEKR